MESHESCLITRDSGDSKSTRPENFQCAVVINPGTSAAAAARGTAKTPLDGNTNGGNAKGIGKALPVLQLPASAWKRAREAYRGKRPFTGAKTREEMQAYHSLLALSLIHI